MSVITSPITAVTLDGTALDLDRVEWAVTVRHGRNDVTAAPEPSSAQLILIQTDQVALTGAIGDTLTITAYGSSRFTGTVTDITVDHVPAPAGTAPYTRVTILAVGPLARLGLLMDGDSGFTAESLEARVDGILTTTGLTYALRADPDMLLLAEDPAQRSVLTILSDLCSMTGATLADTPAGAIVFDSYTRRGYDYNAATWVAVAGAWSAAAGTWSSQEYAVTAAPAAVELDGAATLWEPVWRTSVMPVINDVTVAYGSSDPQDTVTAADTASKVIHGTRATAVTTTLSDIADATRRAGAVITAQAQARWNLQQVEILIDTLATGPRGDVLALVSGDRVLCTDLPQPAPSPDYVGVVEGWGETYTPGGHRLVLSLSDPRYSYAMLAWIAVPGSLTWGATDAAVIWADVILPADLT